MKKYSILICVLLFIFSPKMNAQQLWTSFDGKTVPTKGERKIIPEKYLIFQLNQIPFLKVLSNSSDKASDASIISLPNPDGKLVDFKIWKTSMMEKPLQDKFPEIQTYTASLQGNPRITAKIDWTNYGFHAMIFDGNNTWFIDPYSNQNDGNYIVYYKKDYTLPAGERMSCEVGENAGLTPLGSTRLNLTNDLPKLNLRQSGIIQKTYRLALSCTGEYAEAVAGTNPTVANVLSAMVTTMNRVNGIYQKEVGVTMVLIGNEDTLIYTNPNTDPFTGNANNNGGTLLGLNQSNTNSIIGYANYDIGHIFSTGGGGIASLGCVCAKNQKARGVTGLANPVGDAFDVDYVAHEMGHQFGADHTFNANTGSCNGNGNQSTAYEPGSASTIMGYAGICPDNNIQNHSDAYFHATSLDEISDYLVAIYGGNYGGGASCGTSVTGVTAPSAPEIAASYSIPYETPFELISSKDTNPNDVGTLTYCWEQWNLGNFMQSDAGSASFTQGPSFRSYLPDTTTTRVFPIIDSIINNNTNFLGERLPEVARNLSFKLTVRKVLNGWGTFDISDSNVNINVVNTGAAFKITQPDVDSTDRNWIANSTKTIKWNIAQTNTAPISCNNVNISLSLDGGYTYPIVLATNISNSGTANVVIPNISTNKARVKVKGAGNIFFDISNYDIKITGDTIPPNGIEQTTLNNSLSVYPNPTAHLLHIKSDISNKLELILTNILGQKIYQGTMLKEATIDGTQFSKGVYFLNILDPNSGSRLVKKVTFK